jgi:hypothetical protein
MKFVLLGWVAIVAATQAWPSWGTGIRELFAADVASYQRIAAAAPGLPAAHSLAAQHAQRFPAHWLVGTVAWASGANLHAVYRAASLLCLLGMVLVLARAFNRLGLELGQFAVASGMVLTSVYSFRYLLAAPGMLSDAVFLLGFSVLVLGFVGESGALAVLGIAVATLGRQTAVPLGLVAAAAIVLTWERPRRRGSALLVAATCLGLYAGERVIAQSFTAPGTGGLRSATLLGSHAGFVSADARGVLGVLVPLGVIAGAWLGGQRPAGAPTALAASVLVQPFLLSPTWEVSNEPRLAALALPGLALVAAGQLRGLQLSTGVVVGVSAAMLLASLHPRYTDVGVPDRAAWAALDVLAALGIVLTLALPRWLRLHARRPA